MRTMGLAGFTCGMFLGDFKIDLLLEWIDAGHLDAKGITRLQDFSGVFSDKA